MADFTDPTGTNPIPGFSSTVTSTASKTIGSLVDSAKSTTSQLTGVFTSTTDELASKAKSLTSGLNLPLGKTTPLDELRSDGGWNTNVMNDFQQAAYHIRFFMTTDDKFALKNTSIKAYNDVYTQIKKRPSTTIAESGVTGLNITNLSIDSIVAPNSVTRSVAATNFTLNIFEPMGVSLLDNLVNTAAELRIKNYAKAYYFIEVSFKGYDTTGKANPNICVDFPNGGYWLYMVGITDIAVESTSAGSAYTITCRPYEEQMYETDELKLAEAFIPSAQTLGATLSKLAQDMTRSNREQYGYNIRSYDFRIHKVNIDGKTYDPSTWLINPADIKYNNERTQTMEGTAPAVHFPRGMNLNDVVELLVASCEEAQRLAKNISQKQEITIMDKEKARDCVLLRFEPNVEVSDYDFLTEQYVLDYTIDLVSYYTQVPILTREEITNSKENAYQTSNAQKLRKAGYLCKRYDYLFTGQNSEVLKFDLKFNLAWSAALPRLAGFLNTNTALTANAKVPDQSQETVFDQKQKLEDLYTQQVKLNDKRQENADKLAALNAKNPNELTEADRKLQVDLKSEAATINQDLKKISEERIGVIGKLLPNKEKYETQEKAKLGTITRGDASVAFAEDMTTRINTRVPISISQTASDTKYYAQGGTADPYHRDRSIYGAILNQIYEPMTNGFQSIVMEISGDPYWMGASNVERMVARVMTNNSQKSDAREPLYQGGKLPIQVDYSNGDSLFLLNFKYPVTETSDGKPLLKDNESFTGVYRVTRITHSFMAGQFTQTMESLRMPLIDVFKAFGYDPNKNINGVSTVDPKDRN